MMLRGRHPYVEQVLPGRSIFDLAQACGRDATVPSPPPSPQSTHSAQPLTHHQPRTSSLAVTSNDNPHLNLISNLDASRRHYIT